MFRALTIALLSSTLGASAAAEQPCWMVLGIDTSTSIKEDEKALQRDAYVEAFSRPELVEAMRGCMVRVVEWAEETQVVTGWLKPGEVPAGFPEVDGRSLGPNTSPVALIQDVIALMGHAPGRRLLNITTDGIENVRKSEVQAARATAIAADIEINVLVIGPPNVANADLWWAQQLATGFVFPVSSAADIGNGVWRKLEMELASRLAVIRSGSS